MGGGHEAQVARRHNPWGDRGRRGGLPAGQIDRVDVTQLIRIWSWPLYTGYLVLTGYDSGAPAGPSPALVPPAETGAGGLDLRNLSYAVQWFVFAGFGVFMWWRLVRDDHLGVLRQDDPDPDPEPEPRQGAHL